MFFFSNITCLKLIRSEKEVVEFLGNIGLALILTGKILKRGKSYAKHYQCSTESSDTSALSKENEQQKHIGIQNLMK